MKLVGDLKDKVEKAENQGKAKEIIKEAGMKLTDEEMDQVADGPMIRHRKENNGTSQWKVE